MDLPYFFGKIDFDDVVDTLINEPIGSLMIFEVPEGCRTLYYIREQLDRKLVELGRHQDLEFFIRTRRHDTPLIELESFAFSHWTRNIPRKNPFSLSTLAMATIKNIRINGSKKKRNEIEKCMPPNLRPFLNERVEYVIVESRKPEDQGPGAMGFDADDLFGPDEIIPDGGADPVPWGVPNELFH